MALSFPLSPTAGQQYVGDGVTYQYDGTLSAWIKLSPVQSALAGAAAQTGAAIIPGGTDAERAAITTPAAGMFRYNDQTAPAVMEYYDGTQWVDLATSGGGLGAWEYVFIPGFNPTYVAYGNSKYVALGTTPSTGTNMYTSVSTDGGYTWSTPALAWSTGSVNNTLSFANGVFIADANSAGNPCSATSPDGTTWTLGAAVPAFSQVLGRIAGGNSRFVAPTASGLYYSGDGLNWTVSNVSSGIARAVSYGTGSEFLAVYKSAFANPYTLQKSTDGGQTWSQTANNATTSNTDDPVSMIYTSGKYVYCYGAEANTLSSTADGVTRVVVGVASSYFTSQSNSSGNLFTAGSKAFFLNGRTVPLVSSNAFVNSVSGPAGPATYKSCAAASDGITVVSATGVTGTQIGGGFVAVAKVL